MSKILVLSFNGSLSAPAPDNTHVYNLQNLLSDNGTKLMSSQGCVITKHTMGNSTNVISYYDEVQGAPQARIELDHEAFPLRIDKWTAPKHKYYPDLTNHFVDDRKQSADGWMIMDNVAQAYQFLVEYYEIGDRVYIFSQDTCIARGLICILQQIGLINKRDQNTINDFSLYGDINYPKAVAAGIACCSASTQPTSDANAFKKSYSYANTDNLIHFLGEWCPVRGMAAENIPNPEQLYKIVSHARIAHPINEKRSAFVPLKTTGEGNIQIRYFAGAQWDVSGGYKNAYLSHASLNWILNEAQLNGLIINKSRLVLQYHSDSSLKKQHNSMADTIPYCELSIPWGLLYPKSKCKEIHPIDLTPTNVSLDPSVLDRIGKSAPRNNRKGEWSEKPYLPFYLLRSMKKAEDTKTEYQAIVKQDAVINKLNSKKTSKQ